MKKQFRTAMLSTACMLIVAVMSLTGVTYAWFSQGRSATVTGMQMNVNTASGGVEVSETSDTEGFATDLKLNPEIDTNLFMPVSTTNAKDFYTATIDVTDTSKITSATTGTGHVIQKTLWLRNTGVEDIVVTLDGSSIVSAKNTKNDITKENLVKAARMAILVNGEIAGGIYSPEGTETWNGLNKASSTPFKMYDAVAEITSSLTSVALSDIAITLPGIDAETGAASAVEIVVVIWLEGQDTDANNLNAGGAFNISLQFIKDDVKTNELNAGQES